MNRFFSKLDLRDIKIDPEGTRFPPDADDHEDASDSSAQRHELASADGHDGATVLEPTTWESPTFGMPAAPAEAVVEQDGYAPVDAPTVSAMPELTAAPGANGHAAFAMDGVIVAADGEVLKVSARSRPSAVAGAIAGVVREAGRAEVQAIGAGATNQAVKAVAIARDYLRETGIDAVCVPAFIDVTIENEDRTAIRLVVEPR